MQLPRIAHLNPTAASLRRRSVIVTPMMILLSLALLITAASAPVASATTSAAKQGGVLTVDMYDITWVSLESPYVGGQVTSDQPILSAIYSSFFDLGPQGQLVPDLATKYTVTNHDLTINVFLRPGLKFSDGTALNAAAVAYNWNRDYMLMKAGTVSFASTMKTFVSAQAVSSTEVSATFSQPTPAFIKTGLVGVQEAYVTSPTAIQNESEGALDTDPIGAGPFVVTSDTPNDQILLSRNPYFWNKSAVHLSGMKLLYVGDENSALDDVENNNAQAMIALGGPDPQYVTQAKATAGLVVTKPPKNSFVTIFMSEKGNSPFANEIAREALTKATDALPLGKALYGSQFTVAGEQIYPGSPEFDKSVHPASYNLSAATKLVNQLGGLHFTIIPLSNTPNYLSLAEGLAKEWESAGMVTTIDSMAETAALSYLSGGTYQVFITQTQASIDPAYEAATFYSNPAWGDGDPNLQGKVNKATETFSVAGQLAEYAKLYQYIYSNYYSLPLFVLPAATAILRNTVQGYDTTAPLIYFNYVSLK